MEQHIVIKSFSIFDVGRRCIIDTRMIGECFNIYDILGNDTRHAIPIKSFNTYFRSIHEHRESIIKYYLDND